MNKRRYHGVEFKKVDWNQVCAGIEGERVVVGVDVAKRGGGDRVFPLALT